MEDFLTLGIDKSFVKGLDELKIIKPTEVQQKAIPLLLQGDGDFICQAQTGTGKTAAFGLPLLQRINPKSDKIQGLVLCPTRELGLQISKQLFRFTKYSDKIFTETVYGGPKLELQLRNLQRTTHIIVATPGRLIDLVERKAIDLSHVQVVILDEADEMLNMGFRKILERILNFVPHVKNKWLFSATMPQGINMMVKQHLSPSATKLEIGGKSGVNKNIDHKYVICDEGDKTRVVLSFLKTKPNEQGLIFCKTKDATKKLTEQLQAKGINANGLHGDLLQKDRSKVMRAFKKKTLQILIATDIAARGIDVEGLTYVIHYQLPSKDEFYTHRSGRTARAGGYGTSLVLVTPKEIKQIKYFERSLNIKFSQER